MKVKILRQKSPEDESYWEGFDYNGSTDNTVAGVLDYINNKDVIVNERGEKSTSIMWDCSCMQGVCGACAMVINETPRLACETFVDSIKGNEIIIRPLRKFPVICDLMVDRSIIHDNIKKNKVYIEEYNLKEAKRRKDREENFEHQYTVAKCLKCGLCLEVCPNYVDGKNYYGAQFANECYLVASRNQTKEKEIKKTYAQHFANNCSKSYSCMDVCPVNIPTLSSIGKLNK